MHVHLYWAVEAYRNSPDTVKLATVVSWRGENCPSAFPLNFCLSEHVLLEIQNWADLSHLGEFRSKI